LRIGFDVLDDAEHFLSRINPLVFSLQSLQIVFDRHRSELETDEVD
jgi:hypothetical protein